MRARGDGDRPVDPLVRLAQTEQIRLRSGDHPSSPDPTVASSGSEAKLMLSASPTGSIIVDGEPWTEAQSMRVQAGSHRILITHPRYGACDTTVVVKEGEVESLTCHFRHRIAVRSRPWANVYIEKKNIGESTPHEIELGTGTTYKVGVRIKSRPFTITEGRYLIRGAESGKIVGPKPFSGNMKTIRLKPSFERKIHVLDFYTSESRSRP